jgi:hypothetical protein
MKGIHLSQGHAKEFDLYYFEQHELTCFRTSWYQIVSSTDKMLAHSPFFFWQPPDRLSHHAIT